MEAARALSQMAMLEGGDDDLQSLQFVYQRLLARQPTEIEERILFTGLERTRKKFQEDPEAAKRLLRVGESVRDDSLDSAEHASWTSLCLALFNLDETLSKQ